MSNTQAPGEGRRGLRPGGGRSLNLLIQLVRRDFSMRFMGSALGVGWAILQPLSLVLLYWFVFTIILPLSGSSGRIRPSELAGGSESYALFLIAGLIPWLGFHEGVMRGTTSIAENGALVRKLTFRSDVLVLVPNVSALIFEMIALLLFLVYLGLQGRSLWGLWLLPFALFLQLALQSGIAWLLAAVHVFFRDVLQILGFVLSVLFYLTPILYTVPEGWERFFAWNPLAPLLGLFRSALLAAPLPPLGSIVFLLIITAGVFALGLTFFRRAQASLADLI